MTDPATVECRCFLGGTIHLPRTRLALRPSVYGLIPHADRVLLLSSRHTGRLYPPGGGVEVGERLPEALQREIQEEAGISVEVGALAGFHENFFYYDPTEEAFHSLLFFFHCTPLTFELLPDEQVQDDESIAPRWVPLAGLTPAAFQDHGDLLASLLSLPGAAAPPPTLTTRGD